MSARQAQNTPIVGFFQGVYGYEANVRMVSLLPITMIGGSLLLSMYYGKAFGLARFWRTELAGANDCSDIVGSPLSVTPQTYPWQ